MIKYQLNVTTQANTCRKCPGTPFSREQKIQRQESHRIGVGGNWGIGGGGVGYRKGMIIFRYSRPLLIANAFTHTTYSWQLLIGPTELLSINYCGNFGLATLAEWAELWLVNIFCILFGSRSSRGKRLLTLIDFGTKKTKSQANQCHAP